MDEQQPDQGRQRQVTGPAPAAGPRRSASFGEWIRHTARLWGFLGFIFVVVIVFRQVVLPFALAMLVTYVLAPVLKRLCAIRFGGRTLPRWLWLVGLYLVLFGLLTLFVTLFVPRLSRDTKRIVKEVPHMLQQVKAHWLPQVAAWAERNFGDETPTAKAPATQPAMGPPQREPKMNFKPLPDGSFELDTQGLELEIVRVAEGRWLLHAPEPEAKSSAKFKDALTAYLGQVVKNSESQLRRLVAVGQKVVLGTMRAITTFVLVFMISAFLLADTERIVAFFRNLVPPLYHRDFDNVVVSIDRGLSGAIRGQLLICVVNGLLTGAGLAMLGVKYAFLLALLAGTLSLIPIFGTILSTIPIVLVALVSGTEGLALFKAVGALVWILVIHAVEANLLNPKIIGTAARIHPVIVVFAVVAGQTTYGAMGALLAVPIVSAVQAVFVYVRDKVRADAAAPVADPAAPVADPAA